MASNLTLDTIHCGDAFAYLCGLPSSSINCIVTSPPYFGLRDYGASGQIGSEQTPVEYVCKLVELFREARRVLRDDGTFWLNLGDSYANDDKWGGRTGGKHVSDLHGNSGIGRIKSTTGLPPKSLIGIPWRVAFGLQDDGWILRSEIIWYKPNCMPESVNDRPTKAHETVFLFAKSPHYFYDADAIKEKAYSGQLARSFRGGAYVHGATFDNSSGGNRTVKGNQKIEGLQRNKRTVWTVATKPFKDAHFATFPEGLIEPMILAGSARGGVVFDPFMGAGTTALVARKWGRHYIGSELNPEYVEIAMRRLAQPQQLALLA